MSLFNSRNFTCHDNVYQDSPFVMPIANCLISRELKAKTTAMIATRARSRVTCLERTICFFVGSLLLGFNTSHVMAERLSALTTIVKLCLGRKSRAIRPCGQYTSGNRAVPRAVGSYSLRACARDGASDVTSHHFTYAYSQTIIIVL